MNTTEPRREPSAEPKTSGLAIASLILGICGLCTCGLSAILGAILGIVGLNSISRSAGQLKGQGLAIGGIVTSAVSFFLVPLTVFIVAILMPTLGRAREQARTTVELNNVRQLCLAMMMYCDENDHRFPCADDWPDALAPYLSGRQKVFTSPFDCCGGRAFAMNAQLNERRIREIEQPHRTVLIFEARFGSPPAGGRELLPRRPRGHRGYVIGFMDGHVAVVRPGRLHELIWDPSIQPFRIY